MSDLEQLAAAVEQSFPDAELKLTPPSRPGQAGWLDIVSEERSIAVEWRPGVGFGVSELPGADEDPCSGLFEGPDEVFGRLAEAKRHILELLAAATPPRLAAATGR